MDIRSLYKGIPNNQGIPATKKRYENYIHKTLTTKIILTFLALILTLNNFVLNSKSYLQIKDSMCYGYNLSSEICKYFHG